MKISFSENDTSCILRLHSNALSNDLISGLRRLLKRIPAYKSVALNLQNVDYFSADFLDFLKEFPPQKRLSLIGLHDELFVLLNLTKYDRFANIFLNDIDFLAHRRALLNRRFSVLGNY